MKRVLHVAKFYPPHRGGMETVVYDMVSRQKDVFAVDVLACNDHSRTHVECRDGASITRVAKLSTVASMPICPGLLWRIREFAPDLIHLHMPNPLGAMAVLTSGFKGTLVVHHHSDTLGRRFLRRLATPVVKPVMERADVVIATSQRYLDSSEELQRYRSKTAIVPCGVDLNDEAHPSVFDAAELSSHRTERLVVGIGRLVPYKGFEHLIRAMIHVDGRLLLIGNGPLREPLAQLVSAHSLESKVKILDRVDDVRPYLRAAQVFALPSVSRAEAFGVVQVEAMACGTPVVNTNIDSGVPEVSVHGLTGLTVPPANSEALASAISFLLENPALRTAYGQAARQRVSREYSAGLMVQRVGELYKKLGVAGEYAPSSSQNLLTDLVLSQT